MKKAIFFIFLFISSCAFAQRIKYTTSNAHSHNDYLNDRPFFRAYENGFGSIEADVFPVNGVLCVAHSKNSIQPQRTLKSLYLQPLLASLIADPSRKIKLLVDVKENDTLSLELLIKELEPLKNYLSTTYVVSNVTILISGTRPPPERYTAYPSYIFFDSDLRLPTSASAWEKVGLVSLPFNQLSRWDGIKILGAGDKKIVRHIIDSVHQAGKMIRFWAAPDNEISWSTQMKLGVDLIGTDKIDELGAYLRKGKK